MYLILKNIKIFVVQYKIVHKILGIKTYLVILNGG